MSKDIEYLKERLVELEAEKLATSFQMTPQEAKDQFIEPMPRKAGNSRGHRPLLESEIREALEHVDCAAAVARYLKVSYKTYRKYASRYGLFKANPSGRGAAPKERGPDTGKYPLSKVLAGELVHPDARRLKIMLMKSGKKEKKCERCGWHEHRPDGELPLIINFIDGDQSHQTLDNIKIYCYNCTFCLRGYIRRGVVVFDVDKE